MTREQRINEAKRFTTRALDEYPEVFSAISEEDRDLDANLDALVATVKRFGLCINEAEVWVYG